MKKNLLGICFFSCFVLSAALPTYEEAEKAYKNGDFDVAMSSLRPMADKGDARAEYSLCLMFAKGEGVPCDLIEAFVWGSLAVKHAKDEFYSARSSILLDKVKAKLSKEQLAQALEKLQKKIEDLANRATRPPKCDLDSAKLNLEMGNFDQAIKEYSLLSEKGNHQATFLLGELYQSGKGVEADHSEAGKWFKKGAEAGDKDCQRALALQLLLGQGVAQDDVEAANWLSKAANQGEALSQLNLGKLFLQGRGVDMNELEGFFWVFLAAEGGCDEAVQQLQLLKIQYSPEAFEGVKKRAENWKPQNP